MNENTVTENTAADHHPQIASSAFPDMTTGRWSLAGALGPVTIITAVGQITTAAPVALSAGGR